MCRMGAPDYIGVSIPQAVSTVATCGNCLYRCISGVSIPQAVSTVATALDIDGSSNGELVFQYRKR